MLTTKILVIEDDMLLSGGLCQALRNAGYTVCAASSAREGDELFQLQNPHLVLLDVGLNGLNGFEYCRELRQRSDVPVIFLTAYNEESDVVQGLTLGGDDYITKPFRLKELLARIEAVLRRKGGSQRTVFQSGEYLFYCESGELKVSGAPVELTMVERKLLALLLEVWPGVVTREQAFYQIWDKDQVFVDDNTLNVHIRRLRKKLMSPEGTDPIETIRGLGYRWDGTVVRRMV